MLSDREIINKIFHPNFVETEDSGILKLEEPDVSNVEINGIPNGVFVAKPDKFFPIFGCPEYKKGTKNFNFTDVEFVFSGDQSLCKRSDFLIILEQEKCILFVELKSSPASSKRKDVVNQFKGSLAFLEYVKSLVNIFYGVDDFLADYDKRYVLFRGGDTSVISQGSKRKSRTDFRKQLLNDGNINNTPENFMTMSSTPVYLDKIISPESYI